MNTMLAIVALALIGTYLTIDSIPNREDKELNQLLFISPYIFASFTIHIMNKINGKIKEVYYGYYWSNYICTGKRYSYNSRYMQNSRGGTLKVPFIFSHFLHLL